jgi:DNA-binding YbaB/EbfC family protein
MFGKLGDLSKMMKQAKEMNSQLEEVQKKLADIEVKGESSCGKVTALATCDMVLKKVHISPECIDTSDHEIVEEKVLEACNNALAKAKAEAGNLMNEHYQNMMPF